MVRAIEAFAVCRDAGLDASSGHNPAAIGPEGYPVDWHTVRVHYDVMVDDRAPAVVIESPVGSTERACWFSAAQLSTLDLRRLLRD